MGGSPKRGGSNGGSAIVSRGRVILVAVLALQLVLVVCLMKAPRLIFSSNEEEPAPAAASSRSGGSWLWRRFVISTTAPNCTDATGRVVTEAVKGSDIKCGDRSSRLRMKWIEPPKHGRDEPKRHPAEVASGQLRKVNATTVFRNFRNASNSGRGSGNLRQRRVQVGRDLPATGDLTMARSRTEDPVMARSETGDSAMARPSEGARETKKNSSVQLRRDFAANIRSSLDRDSHRFRGRTVGYGDRQRSSSGDENASASIAPVARIPASNVSAAFAPSARIGASNVSASIARIRGSNVSDSVARIGASNVSASIRTSNVSDSDVTRIRASALVFDDEQPDDEEEDLPEEEDPEVATEVSFGGRQGPLPSFNASRMSNTSLEISPSNTSLAEIAIRNSSLEISPSNTSFTEIATRNSSLEISTSNTSLAEISTRNSSLEISPSNTSLAEMTIRNSSLEILPSNTSLEVSTRNTSLAEISMRNTSLEISTPNASLAEISTRNTSLEISPSNMSLAEISTRNSSLGILPRNRSLEITTRNASLVEISTRDASLESLERNSTSLKEFEQVARSSAAAQNGTVQNATTDAIASNSSSNATCSSSHGLIYVYTLPKKFNTELVENCSQFNRCLELSNSGLGPALNASSGPWYGTNQFNGEVIFHTRMLVHPCRTHNPELAKAFYIPYYGGLRNHMINANESDSLLMNKTAADIGNLDTELVVWLSRSPYWKRRHGLDHFLFHGLRRNGSHGLLHMLEMANVTKLVLERSSSDVAVPYPTGFHPRNDSEVVQWQTELRTMRREFLFSIAGGKRKEFPNDFRGELFQQCKQAKSCAVLDCSQRKCEDDALAATKLFMRSTFCLQPRGNSFTRRSMFDSLIAGCIPVFFWTKSTYLQYKWYFPADYASYSVFIPKKDIRSGVQIEDVLSEIPPAKLQQMQETVLDMIPHLVYAQGLTQFQDAFDTTIDKLMASFELRLHQNTSTVIKQARSPISVPATRSKPAVTARA